MTSTVVTAEGGHATARNHLFRKWVQDTLGIPLTSRRVTAYRESAAATCDEPENTRKDIFNSPALAGRFVFGSEQPAAKPWKMRLSCSSIAFSSIPIEEAIERIAALGFHTVDIWSAHADCPHRLMRISDQAMETLALLPNLEYLYLTDNYISDTGLRYLAKAPKRASPVKLLNSEAADETNLTQKRPDRFPASRSLVTRRFFFAQGFATNDAKLVADNSVESS